MTANTKPAGTNQPGRMLNDFRTLGFNQAENGRIVFDGMLQWIAAADGISGRIEYRRPIMLRLSSVELLAFAVVYAVIFAFTESWFVLGGVFACGALSLNHRLLSRRASAAVRS